MGDVASNYDPDYTQIFPVIVDALVKEGWVVIPNFFSPTLTQALYQELLQHEADRELRPARIGKGEEELLRRDIRGDGIYWLDGNSEDQRLFFLAMEMLKTYLNQHLYLGLHELEAHFALYPPGSGYQKHLDSFRNDNLRRITVVAYLNPEWSEGDGGELNIFRGGEAVTSVLPIAGTLVCFVSEEIPHEVVVTKKKRASIAGWFRLLEAV